MGFLDLFRTSAAEPAAVRREPAVAIPMASVTYTSASDSRALEEMLRNGTETASGALVNPDRAMCLASVNRCVTLISGAIATMPLGVKRRVNDRTRVDASDHPLWTVLRRRPNKWQTPSQFRRQLQTQLLLRGRGYAMKVKDFRGQVQGLIPLHPDRVRTEQLPDFTLAHHYTKKDGSQVIIPQADMFHLVGMTLDGVNGLSVIGCAREAIGLAMQTEKHGASLFKNGTQIGSVFRHPGELSVEAYGRLKTSLDEYKGSENSGKNIILEEGMEFERLGMTSEEAEWLASRGFQDHHVYMFFGVPPHMAGDTSKTTSWGSGIEQQGLGFIAYTLEDWLTTWEESIARDLILENEPELFAKFNRAGLVRGDIKTRYGAYSVGRQWGWLSRNDIRELEDMNPIEGGDDYNAPGNANAPKPADAPSGDVNDQDPQ